MTIVDVSGKQDQRGGRLVVLVVIMLAIILFVAYSAVNDQSFKKIAVETEGRVYYERDRSRDTEDGDYYKTYAEYTVDGKKYYEYVGDKISKVNLVDKDGTPKTIYYNPNNPRECKIDIDSSIASGVIIAVVAVIMLGTYLYIVTLKKKGVNVEANADDVRETQQKAEEYVTEKLEPAIKGIQNARSIYSKIIKGIFVLVSIGVIVSGISTVKSEKSFNENSKEVSATVSKIEIVEDRDSDNHRIQREYAVVNYVVNDEKYEERIQVSGYKKGDTLKIYYDSTNPKNISLTNKQNSLGFFLIGFGIVFLIFTIFIKVK